jgi:peptidoglycan/xylan/chitin deacetylase (PgdA/CDA1 family)
MPLLPRRALRPLTLAYHGVNRIAPEDNAMELVMAPEHLESQVRLLQRLGYRFQTAEQVAATGRPQARGTAVLSFDDGWRDGLVVVAPLLTRLGVRATFYVNPGLWGADHQLVTGHAGRLLTAAEAGTLARDAGMELGAHSMRHDDLRTLDDAALAADLADGKAAVEAVTGRPCRTLAYPFGAYDARVQTATAAAGYALAWAWLPGPWAPLAAPRLPGPTRAGAVRLAAKMTGVRRNQAIGLPREPAAVAAD